MGAHVHKVTKRQIILHTLSVVLNRLGIDGRYVFVFLSEVIIVDEVCVCVCVRALRP